MVDQTFRLHTPQLKSEDQSEDQIEESAITITKQTFRLQTPQVKSEDQSEDHSEDLIEMNQMFNIRTIIIQPEMSEHHTEVTQMLSTMIANIQMLSTMMANNQMLEDQSEDQIEQSAITITLTNQTFRQHTPKVKSEDQSEDHTEKLKGTEVKEELLTPKLTKEKPDALKPTK